MKKLLAMMLMLLAVVITGCQKKVDVGSIILGENYNETEAALKRDGVKFDEQNDSVLSGWGSIYVLDVKFDHIRCEFKNGKLNKVAAWRQLSTLPNSKIENFKQHLRVICGDGYSDTENMVAGYGTKGDNNGCIGGIKVAWNDDEDVFFATIRLAD